MFRKLLATTALATLVATGAYAQDTAAPAASPTAPATENAAPTAPVVRADGSLVSNIVGESVYNGTGDNAESIGKVTDVVFDKDGQAKSIVIGVGGFLGVGAKDVAFDYAKLQWAQKNGDRWLVAQTSKEELTARTAFDRTPYEPAPPPAAAPSGGTATAPSDGTTTAPGADTAMAPSPPAKIVEPDGTLASQVVGESVYNGTADNAEKIGDVKDMVLNKEGKAESLVIGVGGFLGLGQKAVAFDYAKAKWAEKNGDRWFVVEGVSKDELKALPDFDRKAYDPAPASAAAAVDAPPQVTPATTTAAADAKGDAVTDRTAEAPTAADTTATDDTQTAAIDKSTLTEMPADKISADNLLGTTVYGADDADIGKIGDIVLTPDNKVDAVVVDVGSFLGIGAKSVAMGMDNLKFMTDKNGKTYLYTSFTKDQLQAQAAYDKGSYAEKRDEQRMIVR
ncbi:MAG: PRC-barrel domain-containing protein [Mesorhizobium sp.]|nr:PRC-barrel domain-containing protein [Mesorhizobium sp.]MBN9245211.1 PRC-barrel domain-containing protein [Mesorhizobium sp.]MBN9271884.1 PRC-barrel domain-containing protein [Mesorhizobium sp.]